MTVGTKLEVYRGHADKTPGGLEKKDLMKNKWGRIVSLKKHKTAKKEKRLEKAGYFAKKGSFGVVKRGTKKRRRGKSRKDLTGDQRQTRAEELLESGLPPNPQRESRRG